jgi:hypothetical protein
MDEETKQTLASICEILLADIRFSLQINKSTNALARSILDEPTLNQRYAKHWGQMLHESPEPVSPEALRRLEQLEQLIRQLRGPTAVPQAGAAADSDDALFEKAEKLFREPPPDAE